MHRAPLLLPAVAFLTAIVAQAHGYAAGTILVGIAALAFRQSVGIALLLGLAIGLAHGHPASIERELPTTRYCGTVVGDVRADDGIAFFAFAVDGLGTVEASARGSVRAGERLWVRGRLSPLDVARNPGEPSARELGRADGVIGRLAIRRVFARQRPDRRDPRVWLPVVREHLSRWVRDKVPEPEATVLAGALWGERGTLPRDVRDDFQATGTVHVLVTAGLHLGVIAALTTALFAVLRVPRIGSSLATIPVVYAYAALSGWHLPSQRAAAMLTIALLARACGARAISLNTFALAAIVVGASWPVAVESASFALSFSCVGAIVLFAEPIAERLTKLRVAGPIAETLALTLATQIGVWPLTAALFFTVAPYAIVANAIVVPLIGATMVLGLATLVAHALPALSGIFALWDRWLLVVILITTHQIAMLPGARLTIAPPPLWAIAGYDVAAIAAAVVLRTQPIAAILIVTAACAGVIAAAIPRPSGGLLITMLDVGQGDAIVLRTPHGHTILIDTGGRLERGPVIDGQSPAERSADRIVMPYLQRAGITSIDLLVLTHPHGDHVGGSPAILRTMSVGWIADSGQRYGGHAYNDALAEARTHQVPVIVPACHQRWMDDEVAFTFLSPCGPQFADGANDVNENSLVVLVQYRTLRALFMGDAGFQSEERLLNQGVDLHADILKVGHHGSAYSSSAAFIEAIHPRFAIVSVGRHNSFGHPAPATLETLRHTGASIFRTDQCGAVTIAAGVAATPTVTSMLSCTSAPASHEAGDSS